MATGMITRHFDHPSGASAALEMRAGWSKNSYFVLAIERSGQRAIETDRQQFNSREEARQAAVAREREALANGWRPRRAAIPSQRNEDISLHRPTGERIGINVRKYTRSNGELAEAMGVGRFHNLSPEGFIIVGVMDDSAAEINAGDRMLLRHRSPTSERI